MQGLLEMADFKRNYSQWLTMEGWATQEPFSLTELSSSALGVAETKNNEGDSKKDGMDEGIKEKDLSVIIIDLLVFFGHSFFRLINQQNDIRAVRHICYDIAQNTQRSAHACAHTLMFLWIWREPNIRPLSLQSCALLFGQPLANVKKASIKKLSAS